ncbi:uncharacterized protein LOC118267752 [Spodoptera frugiperda]|uniref:Uncharacterized protein LOC118267752 n=1 Tax=Spodoptera frugiperda TaxID=7108 RepID=A0A9R0EJE2_SPOFR|nr:uncharacterized protein LOC118267752 [Spodoptera frugiperda]
MKIELPVCKRCCFCIPLRRGLLVWGYIKLLADLYFLTIMSYILLILIAFSAYGQEFAGMVVVIAVFLIDFAMTIVFIIGAHKKIVKYMRLFYFLSIAMLALTLLLVIIHICLLSNYPWFRSRTDALEYGIKVYSSYFFVIVVQIYFIFLLRSEIIKLKNSCKFRFVNNTAEALCSMECEPQGVPAVVEAAEEAQ